MWPARAPIFKAALGSGSQWSQRAAELQARLQQERAPPGLKSPPLQGRRQGKVTLSSVSSQGVGHRLHGDRRPAADRHGPDHDLPRLAAHDVAIGTDAHGRAIYSRVPRLSSRRNASVNSDIEKDKELISASGKHICGLTFNVIIKVSMCYI